MMELRPYQKEAVAAIYEHLRNRDDNPCVVIPTGAGKTPVMAAVCRDSVQVWGGRVLVLAHVKELLEQAVTKLDDIAPDLGPSVGVYSAGLGSRDTRHPIIVAGIQSVYARAAELGPFDLILVDEAHMLPPDGEGMYRTFLEDARALNPGVRMVGFTATPYRMSSGAICAPENLLNHVCYEVGVREMIAQGYICDLKTKAGRNKPDTSGLHLRGGEFIAYEAETLMDDRALVRSACEEIVEQTRERRSVLIFAAGVSHATHVLAQLKSMGHACGMVSGETLDFDRKETLGDFKAGRIKYLVNVNVLTTGFDACNIDCVALLRPTNSPGLYYQMVGRGFRLHPEKKDCLVLDFGGNILRHGPVDALDPDRKPGEGGEAPAKECPQCQAVIHAGYTVCPECGFAFPDARRAKHAQSASSEEILSGDAVVDEYPVEGVSYAVHMKRGAPDDHPRTMRVDYRVGFNEWRSEWVCVEHEGFALRKAQAWWRARSREPFPSSAQEAVDICQAGGLADTLAITVRTEPGDKYPRIVHHRLDCVPPRLDGSDEREDATLPAYAGPDDDELPF